VAKRRCLNPELEKVIAGIDPLGGEHGTDHQLLVRIVVDLGPPTERAEVVFPDKVLCGRSHGLEVERLPYVPCAVRA